MDSQKLYCSLVLMPMREEMHKLEGEVVVSMVVIVAPELIFQLFPL